MITDRPGRPTEVKSGKVINLYLDADILKDFKEDCDKEGKSLSKAVRDLIKERIEKKEMGLGHNPLGIKFGDPKNVSHQLKLTMFNKASDIQKYISQLNDRERSLAGHTAQQIVNHVREIDGDIRVYNGTGYSTLKEVNIRFSKENKYWID